MNSVFQQKQLVISWFRELRDNICTQFENIEKDYASSAVFKYKKWLRSDGGGGEISSLRGLVFEKVGVNISTVHGDCPIEFVDNIKGCDAKNKSFWASGISVIAHMNSPHIPAAHFNTRMIITTKQWFGGGGDLTPTFFNQIDTNLFHAHCKSACDKFNIKYYQKFKKNCDKYFYLPHRKEHRGVGGIFYDHLNSGNWQQDFEFTKEVGIQFKKAFVKIIKKNIMKKWTAQEKSAQLKKRGRYVEFNLLYDKGTRFGLMTNGNIEAILMSMPPTAIW